MRTLVTGGAGFIGSHLVARLVEGGDEVVVLDSLDPQVHNGAVVVVPDGVTFLHGGIDDEALLDRALEGVDQIVHLAAAVGVGQSMYEIARYVDVNTRATAAFLERVVSRSPRPRRLVVASSMSIYGEGEYECANHGSAAPMPRPEAQLAARQWECRCPQCGNELRPIPTRETKAMIPTSVYAITKRDHEELCLVLGAAYGIPTVALRFFNVYGPGQALSNPYTGVAAIFSSRLLNENPPLVFEDGHQSRDFIHVNDIVEGVVLALASDDAIGQAINLGTGKKVTINDVARLLSNALGLAIQPTFPGQFRAGDIRHCFADITKAKELLGFQPSFQLEDGVGDLVEWVRVQRALDRVDDAADELATHGLIR